jgi:hypothetical protein
MISWWYLIPAVLATAYITYKLCHASRNTDCVTCQYNTAEAFGVVLAKRGQI